MKTTKKILINFAHPAKSKSKINIALRKTVENLDGVTINDLYDHYPDFMIDISREQSLCEAHDVIVFQHPFYWYQAPSIVKEWFDLVLEHGWAYGAVATALKGKLFVQTLTAGGDAASYQADGMNRYTIAELTSPFRATANLCKMASISPFTILGIHRGLPDEEIRFHAENYRRFIVALRDNRLNLDMAKEIPCCSTHLDVIIGKE